LCDGNVAEECPTNNFTPLNDLVALKRAVLLLYVIKNYPISPELGFLQVVWPICVSAEVSPVHCSGVGLLGKNKINKINLSPVQYWVQHKNCLQGR